MNFNWMWGVLSCWLMLLLSALPIFHMWKYHHCPSKQPHCMCDILTNSLQTSSVTIGSAVNMSKRLWPTKTKTWNCMDLSCSWICSLFKHCYNCHICDRPCERYGFGSTPSMCSIMPFSTLDESQNHTVHIAHKHPFGTPFMHTQCSPIQYTCL
jgi:hypothetical protein